MERDCSDEHEEGEIIDDFEDISDYSIPSTSHSGKSVSHRDLLQGVSLSSISDNEPNPLIYVDTYNSRTKTTKRRRKTIHCRRRKKHKSSDYYSRHRVSKYLSPANLTSDSSDEELDAKTQKQLKDAIRIEKSHIHHNSLRTRLKAMLQDKNLPPPPSEDEDVETLRTLALLSSTKDDVAIDEEEKSIDTKLTDVVNDDRDEELIELRLAALKSAVLRKVPEIRKRKCKQHIIQNKDKICEINKENNVNQENNVKDDCGIKKDIESLDNKMTNNDVAVPEVKNDVPRNISVEEDIDIMRAKLLASMSKKISSDLPKQCAPKEKLINSRTTKSISTNTNVFIKQQTKVKPLIINLNDSDSDTDATIKKYQDDSKDINLVNSVNEFLKKQRAAVEAKNKAKPAPAVKANTLDKSVVKLLPKSQQKEYHLLKQKLLLASTRRKRVRKPSFKIDNKSAIVKKIIKEPASKEDVNMKQQGETKPLGLQKALDDIQIKKNGRLQMKGKYKALAPLLQKVTHASIERKQCELEIKTLLESLQKARDKLATSHQNYTGLVMRLSNHKNAIDRRGNKILNNMKIINNNVNTIKSTSTPVKCNIQESVCDISSIHNSQDTIKEADVIIVNNAQTDIKVDLPPEQINSDPVPVHNEDNNALKQYVSPLDSKNRDTVEDPLITFCPFELFGVCKDSECKFNHCSKP